MGHHKFLFILVYMTFLSGLIMFVFCYFMLPFFAVVLFSLVCRLGIDGKRLYWFFMIEALLKEVFVIQKTKHDKAQICLP